MVELQDQLHHEGSGRPWSEVIIVHDFLARVHQSNFRIVHDNVQSLSVAFRTRYATALLAGPQDASHVLLTVSGVFDAIIDTGRSLNAQGVTYVNPETGDQITIHNSQLWSMIVRVGDWAQLAPTSSNGITTYLWTLDRRNYSIMSTPTLINWGDEIKPNSDLAWDWAHLGFSPDMACGL